LQQIRIMRVKGRKHWVHIKDGYYAINKILERKRKRDVSIICKVEWAGSLTTDWVSEDALCRKSCKLLFCFICFNTLYSTRVKLIIIVLYTDKLAKTMYLNVDDDDETDDDELEPPEVKSIESNDNKIKKENGSNEELPEKVKSDGGVKIEEENTDYETDNDTQPSQVESNDKIKKENYGPYDEDTVNGEEQPEEVKSNNLDVKIEEEDTDNE